MEVCEAVLRQKSQDLLLPLPMWIKGTCSHAGGLKTSIWKGRRVDWPRHENTYHECNEQTLYWQTWKLCAEAKKSRWWQETTKAESAYFCKIPSFKPTFLWGYGFMPSATSTIWRLSGGNKITIKVYESHIGPQWKQQITRDACRRRGQLSGQECNALQSFPPVRLSKDEIVHCECFMCL